MSIIQIPPPKERNPGPYPAKRPCAVCGAHLSRYNPRSICDPCSPETPENYGELYEQIAQISHPQDRRKAFQALAEYVEDAA